MMKLPFHLVINFAYTREQEVRKSRREFFSDAEPLTKEQEKEALPLFYEWLIYDYRLANGSSFIIEYSLRNPDNLDKDMVSCFRQVVESQWYGAFEIVRVKRGKWLHLKHLLTGRKIKVYDQTSSATIPEQGTLIGRIGKINKQWYFVGSNPIYLPVTYTNRMKKLFQKTNQQYFSSPKDTWRLFALKAVPPPAETSSEEIKRKRKLVRQEYQSLAKKHNLSLSFKQVAAEIYEEDNVSPLKIFKRLMKQGLPKEVLVENLKIFEDIWNYFPHKIHKGKSPVEVYQEINCLLVR